MKNQTVKHVPAGAGRIGCWVWQPEKGADRGSMSANFLPDAACHFPSSLRALSVLRVSNLAGFGVRKQLSFL